MEISFPPCSLTVKAVRNPAARQEVIGEIWEISVCGCKQENVWGYILVFSFFVLISLFQSLS